MLLPLKAGAEATSQPALQEPVSEVFALTVGRPLGMAYDGTHLWIVDREAAELCALDPRTGQVVRRIEAPGPWPAGLAWDGQLLWVTDPSEERLFGLDVGRQLMVRALPSPSSTPQGLTWDGEALWLADGRQLLRVSTEDGTTLSIIPAPTAGNGTRRTEELGLAWDGNALWVADRNHDTIFRVDVREGEVIDHIPSPGPYPVGMALVGPDLYVADLDAMRVDRILVSDLPNVVRSDRHEQTMSFTHELINNGPGTVATAEVIMAIPRTEASQVLVGEPSFQPAPAAIVTDRYGQRAARFTAKNLAPGKSLRVVMKVRAKLFEARYHIRPERVGSLRSIPGPIKRLYLSDSSKYRLRDKVVQDAVREAVGDERNPYWMSRKIFRYLHKQLHYELAGGWDAVPVVLSRGSGSCSEYTMSFVSMCRAVGIPARYAGAIVVRGDDASTDEVFHRWAEIYLPNYGWVPVDAQAGDQSQPSRVGAAYGKLSPRFLITTRGGGGSKHMGWTYNSSSTYTCKGRCQVVERTYGDWRRPGHGGSKAVP
jgi:sugar lactone lactonase YvrE